MKFHHVSIERPAAAPAHGELTVNRGLKSGKLDRAHLSEDELVRLITEASQTLARLRGVRYGL